MSRIVAFVCCALAVGQPVSAVDLAGVREAVRAHRRAREAAILRELVELLALPNVASDREGIRRNADRIAAMLERRGVSARLLDGAGGPPVVYGELAAPGARRTVVVYVHYDGQPVVPAQWTGDPWTPVLRDKPLDEGGREVPLASLTGAADPEWRLYARSASDDKAPIVGFLAALDALATARIPLSVNVKFFFEGEEEAGSPHLRQVLEANRELLKADAWILCDGPVHQTRRMQVYFGARGVTDVELTVYGPVRALHSGHYGNWAPNPAVEIAHLVAALRDRDGRVAVPGFYDDLRPASETERRALAEAPPVDEDLRRAFGLARTEADGARLVDRLMLPALNVRGIAAGGVGAGAANAIPTEATASIDFRLVPDQTPAGVRERLEAHLRALGYAVVHEAPTLEQRRAQPRLVRLQWGAGYPAARASMDLPVSRAVLAVVEGATGRPVVRMPTLGGSIPMYLFEQVLGTPVIGLPIANHDNNQHAANENIRLQNLWDGIEVYAGLLAGLGAAWTD
jgi:acetylornithine deacetylase/succinyl-diaminopimelate desuccinylase-like protein